MLRKFNAIISMAALVLLIIHAVMGGFNLLGISAGGNMLMWLLADIMLGCIIVHIIIGIVLTVKSIRLSKKSGASYPRENRLFWLRRISGFAIIIFIVFHLSIFIVSNEGAVRLTAFEGAQLIFSILLVATVAVHIISNIKPLLISFGFKGIKFYVQDILFILMIILLFATTAFIVYFIRWNL